MRVFGLEVMQLSSRRRGGLSGCALNRRDLALPPGLYGGAQSTDRIPLSDGAGEVIAIGAGVSEVAVGDIVVSANLER